MRKILTLLLALLPAAALAQNYTATQGVGTTFGSKLVGGVNYPQAVFCDPATPANCATVKIGNATALTDVAVVVSDPNLLSAVNGPIAAGTNLIGKVGIDQTTPGTTNLVAAQPWASTTGGTTQFSLIAANTTNSTSVKGSAGTVYSIQTGNISASTIAYLKLYDKATAPTCGTDTPTKVIVIPANSLGGGNNVSIPVGAGFTSGIGICVTAGIANNDTTAVPLSSVVVNLGYK